MAFSRFLSPTSAAVICKSEACTPQSVCFDPVTGFRFIEPVPSFGSVSVPVHAVPPIELVGIAPVLKSMWSDTL